MAALSYREYRLAPEYRRCCWYVLAAVPILAAMSCLVGHFVHQHSPVKIGGILAFFVLLAGAMVYALLWRVRVDADGITTSPSLSDTWTWEDLASGRIVKQYPYTLYDPERPGWRRRLRLEYLANDDLKQLFWLINIYYQLPPAPDIPTAITIKYGFRREATFDGDGIRLTVRGTTQKYAWADVQHLYIVRLDPLRRDFARLVLKVPDHEIEVGPATQQYYSLGGATSEKVNGFLLNHVPPERISIILAGDELKEPVELERRIEQARKAIKQHTIFGGLFALTVVGVAAWFAVNNGPIAAAAMAALLAIYPGLLVVAVHLLNRRGLAEREARLRGLLLSHR